MQTLKNIWDYLVANPGVFVALLTVLGGAGYITIKTYRKSNNAQVKGVKGSTVNIQQNIQDEKS